MTLTHILNVEWADSSTDRPAHNGLTDFGKQVIREMNRAGHDGRHLPRLRQDFPRCPRQSAAPLIATHSSCRALCDSPRNLTDEMIRQLAAKGGVVQINFHVGFLSDSVPRRHESRIRESTRKSTGASKNYAAKITPAGCSRRTK